MKKLLNYLKTLSIEEKHEFCARCGTTLGYLRNAASTGKRLGESYCINIERESGGVVRCESLRPDVDWSYLRGTESAA